MTAGLLQRDSALIESPRHLLQYTRGANPMATTYVTPARVETFVQRWRMSGRTWPYAAQGA